MDILVTGGAGFLGSHLCERLLEQGNNVTCLDDLSTGFYKNISHLDALTFVRRDVSKLPPRRFDQIYNLACPASPVHYQFDPINTFQTSVLGALAVLREANEHGSTVLQASTSEVYGDPSVHPQPESYWGNVNPIGPRSCYDEGKRGAETLFFDFQRTCQTDIRVARIFNTYGPRMAVNDGRVVSNFIVQALKGEPLTIYGDGRQTRSFCYVDDLIDGLTALMSSQETFPVNLGNPSEFTMLELATAVIELTGSVSKIEHRPLPVDDPKQRKPDITRAKAILNWRPKVDLQDGLKETIAYFRKALA
jgi:UDP-glucuronate decarboxylase